MIALAKQLIFYDEFVVIFRLYQDIIALFSCDYLVTKIPSAVVDLKIWYWF